LPWQNVICKGILTNQRQLHYWANHICWVTKKINVAKLLKLRIGVFTTKICKSLSIPPKNLCVWPSSVEKHLYPHHDLEKRTRPRANSKRTRRGDQLVLGTLWRRACHTLPSSMSIMLITFSSFLTLHQVYNCEKITRPNE
jgi:hypothetical protein